MNQPPLRFMGAPGSPYTRKMLAYLRYRRVPYEFLMSDQAEREGLPRPKVALLPTFYLPGADGALEAAVDSTPLIRRFEGEFDGRAAIPPDPAVAFLNDLVEDYADEWLTKEQSAEYKQNSLKELSKSFDCAFKGFERIRNEKGFDHVRDLPEFKELMRGK